MKERDVFSELLEGMTEWREFNAGNETLRSHSSCLKPFILPARRAKRGQFGYRKLLYVKVIF